MNEQFSLTAILSAIDESFTRGLNEAKQGLEEFQNKTSKDLKNVSGDLKDVGGAMTKGLTLPIVAGATAAVKASSDFETAFTGVKKTVDESDLTKYSDLEKGIRDMAKELPFAATEIAGVAEQAGQLGIETDNVLSFTKTIMDMGVSTNLSAEEAAEGFAKFANVMKTSQKDFDKLGSAIVNLGNNTATTEKDILSMATRLSRSVSVLGFTETEVLGLSAAMSSVGINAEAGGSSMGRVAQKINSAVLASGEDLQKLAQISGTTNEEFSKLWKEDKTQALMLFLKGLKGINESGKDATATLKDLGINSVNDTSTILTLSNSYELLSKTMDIANQGWNENSALSEESGKAYQTLANKLVVLKNKLNDIFIDFGGPFTDALIAFIEASEPFLQMLSGLAKGFSEMDKGTQQTIVSILLIVATIGPLLSVLGSLGNAIANIGKLKSVFTMLKTGFGIAPLVSGLSGVVKSFLVTTGTSLLALASPLTLIIGLVAIVAVVLGGLFIYFYKTNDEFRERVNNTLASIGEWFSNLGKSIVNIIKYIADNFGQYIKLMINVALPITNVFEFIYNSIKKFGDGSNEAFSNTSKRFSENVKRTLDGLSQFFEAGKKLMQSIFDVFVYIGANIINGILEGINRKIEQLTKVINFVAGMIDKTFRKVLRIKSPSRVMAENGKWTMLGLKQGLERYSYDALGVVEDLATDISDVGFSDNLFTDDLQSRFENSLSVNSQVEKQPAYINLGLGNRDFEMFVSDIFHENDKQVDLEIGGI